MTARPGQSTAPTRQQQAAAWLAYLALAAAALFMIVVLIRRWEVLLAGLVTLSVTVVAAWFAVSRRGTPRLLALVVGAASLVVFAVVMVASQSVRVLIVGVALVAVSAAAARVALRPPTVDAATVDAAPPARHAVLIMNPWSGGGKVEKFDSSGCVASAASSRSCSTRALTCWRSPRMPWRAGRTSSASQGLHRRAVFYCAVPERSTSSIFTSEKGYVRE